MKRNILLIAGSVLSMIVMASVKFHPYQNKTYVDCPKLVAVGDKFNLDYVFKSGQELEAINPNDIRIKLSPTESNAEFIFGPVRSVTTSTSWNGIFGKTIETSIKWSFTFLAISEGVFEVPDYTLISDSDTLKPNPVKEKIRFVSTNFFDDDISIPSKSQKDFNQADTTRTILRLEIDKKTVQLGDSIICSVILLCNVPRITQLAFEKKLEIRGCDIIPLHYDNEHSIETINKTTFHKWTIGKYKIIPSKKGKYKITPISVKGETQLMGNNVDMYFGKENKYVLFENKSNTLHFKVK